MHRLEDVEGEKPDIHFIRDKDGREVDFLITMDQLPALFTMVLVPVGVLWLIGIPLPLIANFVTLLSVFLSVLTIWVILERGAQDDFESMGYAVYASALEPNPVHSERELLAGVVFGVFLVALFDHARTGSWAAWLGTLGPGGV